MVMALVALAATLVGRRAFRNVPVGLWRKIVVGAVFLAGARFIVS